MRVYFLRHAHAEYSDGLIADEKRQLTDKGVNHTRRLAQLLKLLDVKLDRLFASPLVRAQQTANIIGAALDVKLETRTELAPGFNLDALEVLVRDIGTYQSVMIVGHEPDFSRVIGDVTGGRVIMKKGGLAWVEIAAYDPLHGELIALITPKIVEHIG